jgi:Flp pilus assembly protein TadD
MEGEGEQDSESTEESTIRVNIMTASMQTQIAVIATKVESIENKVDEIGIKLEGHYVTKEEFDPVKKIIYGVVGLILTSVVGALLALVVLR